MKKYLLILIISMLFITGCETKKEENKKQEIKCPDGVVENGKCKVKAEEYEAPIEDTCKENQELIEGICIKKDITEPYTDYTCDEGLTLEGTTCSGIEVKEPIYSCEIGTLSIKKCIKKTLVGDATPNCNDYPDPKIYKNGNCYLGLPMLPEGCEAGDTEEDGWCYNLNNPKAPSYSCATGKLDSKKCYEIIELDADVKCENDYTLETGKCVKTITGVQAKEELKCEPEYKLEGEQCTKIVSRENAIPGPVCSDPDFVLEDNKCVRYEYK